MQNETALLKLMAELRPILEKRPSFAGFAVFDGASCALDGLLSDELAETVLVELGSVLAAEGLPRAPAERRAVPRPWILGDERGQRERRYAAARRLARGGPNGLLVDARQRCAPRRRRAGRSAARRRRRARAVAAMSVTARQ